MTMQASEKLFLQTVGRFVAERFKTWIAPISERVEKIERALAAPPQARFTAGQIEEMQRIIAATVQEAFITGKIASTADIEKAIANIPAGPPGKDGKDGADGADGKSITAADLDSVVDAKVSSCVAALPVKPHIVSGYVDRDGNLYFTASDGGVFKVGHVVGADADPAKIAETIKSECAKIPLPKDGKDGFGLDNFTAEFDGERTLTLRFADAAHSKEVKVILPYPLYRGVWREGDYVQGDSVTHEGSTWIALANTSTRPGTPGNDWQLAVKRGRDGKEGKAGPEGTPGKDGRDGRDLTQLGPDGRKW